MPPAVLLVVRLVGPHIGVSAAAAVVEHMQVVKAVRCIGIPVGVVQHIQQVLVEVYTEGSAAIVDVAPDFC